MFLKFRIFLKFFKFYFRFFSLYLIFRVCVITSCEIFNFSALLCIADSNETVFLNFEYVQAELKPKKPVFLKN